MSEDEPVQDTLMALILQMDERQQWLFACDCAERMIPRWERKRHDGKRPHGRFQGKRIKTESDRFCAISLFSILGLGILIVNFAQISSGNSR